MMRQIGVGLIGAAMLAACTRSDAPLPSAPSEPHPDAAQNTSPQPPAPARDGAPPDAPPDARIVDERRCVVDMWAHAAEFIVAHHGMPIADRLGRPAVLSDFSSPGSCFGAATLPDLDGDGEEEIAATEGCSWGTHGALHLLYFSNKGCRRFAGDLISGELAPLDTANAGVRDLEANWSNGCAGRDFEWARYRWNGNAYVVADKATCAFCDQPDQRPPAGANRHPHCVQAAKSFSTE